MNLVIYKKIKIRENFEILGSYKKQISIKILSIQSFEKSKKKT